MTYFVMAISIDKQWLVVKKHFPGLKCVGRFAEAVVKPSPVEIRTFSFVL